MLVNGKMILQLSQDICIEAQRIESITQIGFEHQLFNWSFLFIALSTQQMLVDLTQKRIQELNKRKTESSSVSYKSVSLCFSTFQEWEPLFSTLREKDSVISQATKSLDLWCLSQSPFLSSLSQGCTSDNNTKIFADQMERISRMITGLSRQKPCKAISLSSCHGCGTCQPSSSTAFLPILWLLGPSGDPEKFHLMLETTETSFSCKLLFSLCGYTHVSTWILGMAME